MQDILPHGFLYADRYASGSGGVCVDDYVQSAVRPDKVLGIDINWLYDSRFALPALMAMTVWKDFGYAVILFLSGLMSLPSDCYESSEIDGANAWQTFRYITLPLLRPTMLFVVVTSIISYLQAYVPVLVMTKADREPPPI